MNMLLLNNEGKRVVINPLYIRAVWEQSDGNIALSLHEGGTVKIAIPFSKLLHQLENLGVKLK